MKNTSYLTEPELQKTLGIKSVDEKLRSTPYMLISSEQKKPIPLPQTKRLKIQSLCQDQKVFKQFHCQEQ